MKAATKRRTAWGTLLGSMIIGAGLVAAPVAQAEPADRAADGVLVEQQLSSSTRQHARVADYWTADRMKAAKPLDAKPSKEFRSAQVQSGEPSIVHGAAKQEPRGHGKKPKDNPYLGGPWTGGGDVVATTGKVFFTLGGTDYVCSGSVVPADNKSTVTTAGHCVNEGPGDFVTNFSFVPGYDNGEAPYGEWTATSVATTTEWAEQGDFNYDVGFAVVGQVDGQYLTDAVGSQSIGFNQPRGEAAYSFGYPAASPYDGEELDYCSGTTGDDSTGQTEDLRLDCNMTGGSSGGPWFGDFDETSGTGTQISVNSFGYTNEPDAMYGPYFGDVIEAAYNEVQSAA